MSFSAWISGEKEQEDSFMMDAAQSLVPETVATNITSDEPRAVITHLYGHCINIPASNSMQTSRILKDTLETNHEIIRFIKYSPIRDSKLKQIRKSSEGQLQCWICLLWPTRWTVRADAMTSVISNYSVLHELLDWSLGHRNEGSNSWSTGTHAAIRVHIWLGVGSQSAPAYWQLECVCPQRKSLSAAEGLSPASITISWTLKSMRADEKFALFCKDVHNLVNAPVLPRRRRLPARYEDGNAPAEFYETPETRYRHV